MLTITTNLGTCYSALGTITLTAEGEVELRVADERWARFLEAAIREAIESDTLRVEVREPRGAREKHEG